MGIKNHRYLAIYLFLFCLAFQDRSPAQAAVQNTIRGANVMPQDDPEVSQQQETGLTSSIDRDEDQELQDKLYALAQKHAPAAAEALANDQTLEFSLQDLNIFSEDPDEREAQAQTYCSIVLGLLEVVPKGVTCGCRADLERLVIDFSCNSKMCLPKVGPIDLTNVCVVPSYKSTLSLSGVMNSTACNDPMTLSFQLFGFPVKVPIPQVCAFGTHQRKNLKKLSNCRFNVGKVSCSCSVCETGKAITVDCTNTKALGLLAPYAIFDCIGLEFLGIGDNAASGQSFVNPFVELAAELSQQPPQAGPQP